MGLLLREKPTACDEACRRTKGSGAGTGVQRVMYVYIYIYIYICIYVYIYIYTHMCVYSMSNSVQHMREKSMKDFGGTEGYVVGCRGMQDLVRGAGVRPVRLLRVWISEGLTQADS